MSATFSPLSFQNGAVLADQRASIYISTDYPYYRDDPLNWRDRLASLKSLGITNITFYIPWRHHQPEPDMPPDFSGKTQPNRNVLGFIDLCAELGLAVVAKPGPFIHAEVNYGGLPDWVCPQLNPAVQALEDGYGEAVLWAGARLDGSGQSVERWPLPAPFSPEFLRLTRQWLRTVGEQVIRPHQAPSGPIVAIQVANEGLYSNGQHAPWAYDYSPSALKLFAEFLSTKYQSLERYNQLHSSAYPAWDAIPAPRPTSPSHAAQLLVDWGEFSAEYMERVFSTWVAAVGASLPALANQNPPLATHYGLDAWLSRVEPERWPSVHYGFTNWVGDVSADPSAFQRYVLTAKRTPGPNMEENWGFARLYAPAYVDASTSFYQTLVILNNGATGFNIYTGASTAFRDLNLEALPIAPYPDVSPITERGELTSKAEIVRWLVKFFDQHGSQFLACRTHQPAAWGYSLPQARAAAWSAEQDLSAAQHGLFLAEFQRQMRSLHLDYGLLNLHTASLEEISAYPNVFIAGEQRMAASVQQTLADYARQGGKLTVCGAAPQLDEAGAPCSLLSQAPITLLTSGKLDLASSLAGCPCPEFLEGTADVWVRSHPSRDLHFVTLLIPAGGSPTVRLNLPLAGRTYPLNLSATPSGGAILRVENGQVTAAIIKGHNAFLGCAVPPQVNFDGKLTGQEAPGDIFAQGSQQTSLVYNDPIPERGTA